MLSLQPAHLHEFDVQYILVSSPARVFLLLLFLLLLFLLLLFLFLSRSCSSISSSIAERMRPQLLPWMMRERERGASAPFEEPARLLSTGRQTDRSTGKREGGREREDGKDGYTIHVCSSHRYNAWRDECRAWSKFDAHVPPGRRRRNILRTMRAKPIRRYCTSHTIVCVSEMDKWRS